MGGPSYQAGNKFRRQFTDAERRSYRAGDTIWWRDGGKTWRRGRVVRAAVKDVTGAEYVTVMNTDKPTKNVDSGETTRAYPDGIKKA